MTWSLMLETLAVMAVYLMVDRSAFWFMSNTFEQVAGKVPGITYAEAAFPRLFLALAGCIATVFGRTGEVNMMNVAGVVAILTSLAILCFTIMRRYLSDPNS